MSTGDVLVRLPGLAALAMCIAFALDLLTSKLVGFDLAAYILGARRLLSGAPLYQTDLTALGPFGQFLYPPPVAVLFVPLALLPFDLARAIGVIALVLAATALTWWLVRDLRPGTRYWAAAATVLFFPLIWEVSLENLTLVTLLLCIQAWRLRGNERLAGLAFAAALGLKLLPLALIAFFIIGRRGRVVAWCLLALALVLAISLPFLGQQWVDYVLLLGAIARNAPGAGSNIAPVLFSAPALRPALPVAGIIVALACGLASQKRETEEHCFRVALAAVPLLASTLWYPYLVFALPLLVSSAPHPRRLPFRAVLWVARPGAWYLMQWQVIRDPGRDFLLPIVGLLLLIVVGLTEIGIAGRRIPEASPHIALALPA